MSPGGTMLRVYGALKARILSGGFAPGERLDPSRLASDLAASATPVRDALNRLSGERLVDSAPQEGFRQPLVSEPAIRDLYEWGYELTVLVARAGFRHGAQPSGFAASAETYGDSVARCFRALSNLSTNHEHRWAIASLLDRSAILRPAEERSLTSAIDDVIAIERGIADASATVVRRALDQFHRRRLRAVPAIANALRTNSQ